MYPYLNSPYPQIQQLQPQLQTPVQSQVVKVNGRPGAMAYKLAPNSSALLLDANEPIVWLVESDGAAYTTATPYDIVVHQEVNQEDTIKALQERIDKLEEKLNGKSNIGETRSKKSGDQQQQ